MEFTVRNVTDTTDKVIVNAAGSNRFDRIYSSEGLTVWLPWVNTSFGALNCGNASASTLKSGQLGFNATNSSGSVCTYFPSTYVLQIYEEDEDDNIAAGGRLNVTIGHQGTDSDVGVTTHTGAAVDSSASTGAEIGDTDVLRSFIYGDLATEVLYDTSGDQDTLKLVYHGSESYGEVFLLSSETVLVPGGTGAGGQVELKKDTEVQSVAGKHLVVVGGSCVNTVAAKMLGSDSPVCGDAFTARTNVGAGGYIVKTMASPYNAAKVAMLVAGYHAADTTNAVKRVMAADGSVMTDVGSEEVFPVVA
jgi:hypothetical protein